MVIRKYRTTAQNGKLLFYVDFIISMKNGHVYLFDTKSIGSDAFAHEKHNALMRYIKKKLQMRLRYMVALFFRKAKTGCSPLHSQEF